MPSFSAFGFGDYTKLIAFHRQSSYIPGTSPKDTQLRWLKKTPCWCCRHSWSFRNHGILFGILTNLVHTLLVSWIVQLGNPNQDSEQLKRPPWKENRGRVGGSKFEEAQELGMAFLLFKDAEKNECLLSTNDLLSPKSMVKDVGQTGQPTCWASLPNGVMCVRQ